MRRLCRSLRAVTLAAVIVLLTGCATLVPVAPGPVPDAGPAEAAWARVLARFVDDRGRVDFAALAADRDDLDTYLRHVAHVPIDGPGADDEAQTIQRLAHLINAYNALSMHNVVASGIPDTHAGLRKIGFFLLRRHVVGGRMLSLYAFENDVIRPLARAAGEPGVHFALNCSALSCPALPRTPFVPGTLRADLARETRAFFARPENFRIDDAAREVWLNEILDFYTEDFVPGHGRNLIDYANRHAPVQAPLDYRVRFTPYDWTIANQRGVGAR